MGKKVTYNFEETVKNAKRLYPLLDSALAEKENNNVLEILGIKDLPRASSFKILCKKLANGSIKNEDELISEVNNRTAISKTMVNKMHHYYFLLKSIDEENKKIWGMSKRETFLIFIIFLLSCIVALLLLKNNSEKLDHTVTKLDNKNLDTIPKISESTTTMKKPDTLRYEEEEQEDSLYEAIVNTKEQSFGLYIEVYEVRTIKKDKRKELIKTFVERLEKMGIGTIKEHGITDSTTFKSPHVYYNRNIVNDKESMAIIQDLKRNDYKYRLTTTGDTENKNFLPEHDKAPPFVVKKFRENPELDMLIFR